MAQTLNLARPVDGADGPILALTFREPTGKDIRECGVPFTIGEGGAVQMHAESMARHMARLAGVQDFVIDRLTAGDWNAGMGLVMGFFGASTPPGS